MDFDRQSLTSMGRPRLFERPGSDIKKTGYMKKMKTMKKKFFVLRSTSSSGPARLEYFDSEKKFKANHPPKRSIHLHTCFNINKKSDSRHGKYGIVLYTNEEGFTVLTETEEEQEAWLSVMLEFQNEYLPDGDMHKEHYEHVWQVTLQPRGLGQKSGKGQYRLCLNSTTISLVKANLNQPCFATQLVTIRSVAHNECSFRMEVGKYAPTGEGEFWFTVDDSSIAKDMHSKLLHYMSIVTEPLGGKDRLRPRSESHSSVSPGRQGPCKSPDPRPFSFCQPSSMSGMDGTSPTSPVCAQEHLFGQSRPSESRNSWASVHHDDPDFIMTSSTGSQMDKVIKEHISVVPPDMEAPPSPGCLDEQMNAYLQMDLEKERQAAAAAAASMSTTSPSSSVAPSYFTMNAPPSQGHSGQPAYGSGYIQKGEFNPPVLDGLVQAYMTMGSHHPPPLHMSAPIPIHTGVYTESHHSTPLPTVKEGGSNEGYLPMDMPNSPASSTGVLRPDRATCLLSDDPTGLPPRTYSLGSKPVTKKYHGYVEMGPKKGAIGNDISRATSAPHIIHKGRRDRDRNAESPTPSASPLSMSVKSDDSDSFMEYMPMRPRTASDSFNYRPRTSSFGKLQPTCRPRSSSHGQGTRPFTKFSKLSIEQSRISQDPLHRASQESSLHSSFDSLHVSNESLRRMSQDMRQPSGSNASDYADSRGTPSPLLKNVKAEMDGYVNMQPNARKSSPHRMRTDSSGSGRRPDIISSSSERLHHHQQHLQEMEDYTEMTPVNSGGGSGAGGDPYVNMDYGSRHSFSSDARSVGSASSSSIHSRQEYVNMEPDSRNKSSDGGRSMSMENVDTYVVYDPSHGSGTKPRTGSLGSKEKKVTSRPGSARKSSSASMSSSSPSSSLTAIAQQVKPTAASSTRTGGSSDSIRKTPRQSSMEKYGSLGKDFRKKSGSTGSRPMSMKDPFRDGSGGDHHLAASSLMPIRKPTAPKTPIDDPADEYVEFAPTATKGDSGSHHAQPAFPPSGQAHHTVAMPHAARASSFSSGGSFSSGRSPSQHAADEDAYTMYDPAPSQSSRSVHFHQPQQQQQQQQQQHHMSYQPYSQQPRVGQSSASSSGQAKQVAAKEVPEYVGFEPGIIPSSSSFSSSSSSSSLSHVKQTETKDDAEYVGYEPGVIPSTSSSSSSLSAAQAKHATSRDLEEYVGYEPGIPFSQHATPQPPGKPISPNSAMSYIQSSGAESTMGKSLHRPGLKLQQASVDSAYKPSSSQNRSGSVSPRLPNSSSLTFEPQGQGHSGMPSATVGLSVNPAPFPSSQSPPVPVPSPASASTAQRAPTTVSKPVVDDSEYLSYNPAVPPLPVPTACKENVMPMLVKGVSYISSPATSQVPQPSSVTSIPTPFAQLSVDVGADGRENVANFPSSAANVENKPVPQKQQQQQQQLKHAGGYHRQMSAPVGQSSPSSKPFPGHSEPPPSQMQPPFPQPLSPLTISDMGSRQKHQSGSSVTDSPSPTSTGTRHKHWSGSSNSSQKSSRLASSDSEKPLRKGSKSDSNSSLNSSGGKTKRRIPSGEKSPGGSAEKSPLSPSRGGGDEFFCGEASPASGKSLESKIVPVESKIRHSLGDVTGVMVNKESRGQGLVRPGSTPCMQNLETIPDHGSRSAGDVPSPHSRSSNLQFSGGPRSRHSLSDLAEYQQMSFASLGSEKSGSAGGGTSNNSGGSGGGNGGSGDSCGSNSSEPPPKPLNYVKLDLSCPEGQGDADGKSPRVKSRNSSDADERQPPLSYAEIDFVKSQNYNKALALGGMGDNSSKS